VLPRNDKAPVNRHDVDGKFRYRQRPENRLADTFVETPRFRSDHVTVLGLEAATVLGPVSMQAEYMRSMVDRKAAGLPSDLDFDGYYVMADLDRAFGGSDVNGDTKYAMLRLQVAF